jgi:hypothetical protein
MRLSSAASVSDNYATTIRITIYTRIIVTAFLRAPFRVRVTTQILIIMHVTCRVVSSRDLIMVRFMQSSIRYEINAGLKFQMCPVIARLPKTWLTLAFDVFIWNIHCVLLTIILLELCCNLYIFYVREFLFFIQPRAPLCQQHLGQAYPLSPHP